MKRPLLLLVLSAIGCRIAAVDGTAYSDLAPRNLCELGCATDVACVDGACIASQTAYPLVFEITPMGSFGRGVTFVVPIDDKTGSAEREIRLDEPARIVAQITGATSVTLELEKVDAVPGAARSIFRVSSFPGSSDTPALSIPPGDYRVYVAPTKDSDLALLPPVLIRDDATGLPLVQRFASGAQRLEISYAGLRTIKISLTTNAGAPLVAPNEARDIFVVDDTTGALASTIAHTCLTAASPLASEVDLTLAPALTGHRYTLRVAPAATACSTGQHPLATIDYDLQALDVEGRGNHVELAMPVTQSVLAANGQIKAFGSNTTINDATVVLRSTQLDPEVDAKAGKAWLEVSADAGGSGVFTARNLLPGTYRATVIPGTGLALGALPYAICVDCTIPSQVAAPPGTRVYEFKLDATHQSLDFEVARRVTVTIGAGGFDGALFGKQGTFESEPSSSESLFDALGTRLMTRRASGALLGESSGGKTWNVRTALDPGAYDIVIRTPQASGYPWIVLPHLEVAPAPKLEIGVVPAKAPVIFSGRIVDPSGNPVPRATLRARALIADKTDPKAPALGAVLVGETRAGEDGSYRIVVPSDFSTVAKKTSE